MYYMLDRVFSKTLSSLADAKQKLSVAILAQVRANSLEPKKLMVEPSPEEELIVRIGDLTITRRRGAASTAAAAGSGLRGPPPPGASEAPSAAPEAEVATSHGGGSSAEVLRCEPPVLPPEEPRRGSYVIYSCRKQPGLVGIDFTTCDKLPSKTLLGSGARTAKRFDDREEAVAYFRKNSAGVEPVIYKY